MESDFDWAELESFLKEGWEKKISDVRLLIRAGIKYARKKGIKRFEIAEKIGITENMLNKWTRNDGNGSRFPYECALRFAEVTGDPRILLWLPTKAGLSTLLPKEQRRYEAWKLRKNAEFMLAKADLLEKESE